MPHSTNGRTLSQRVLAFVALIAGLQAVVVAVWYWPGSLPDTKTSGVWIALADDVAHGDWYRPLQSELGTGGTRYMPLFFSLHGGLIRAGLPPVVSGAALTLGSAILFVLGLGLMLTQLGIARHLAWPAAVLMAGTASFGMTTLAVRGDFLAAALNLWGIAAALRSWREPDRSRWWILAALCFAAAFLTKLTTVFGITAMCGWMLWQRAYRPALRLALTTGVLAGIGIGLTLWASDGRMWRSFAAVASGGTDHSFILSGPGRMIQEAVRDPLLLIMFIPGIICLISPAGRWQGSLPRWLAVGALAVTMVIFASPGTSSNPLIELGAMGGVGLAVGLHAGGHAARIAGLAALLLGAGIFATWLPGTPSIPSFFQAYSRPSFHSPAEFLRRAGPAALPVLSENPVIPIQMGTRPFVADMFNLRLMTNRDPAFRAKIMALIEQGEFGSIVLTDTMKAQPHDIDGPEDPRLTDFKLTENVRSSRLLQDIARAAQSRYRIVLVRRPYLYLLRNDLTFDSPQP